MRIAHVITRLIVGGAQENTVASVIGLHSKPGIEVELISGPTSGSEGSLLPLIQHHGTRFSEVGDLIRPVHPVRDFRALRHLEAHFRRTRPDIVHTHSGKAGLLGRLAARRAGVSLIVHTIHGPSFGRFQGPLANLAFTAAERMAGRVTDHFVAVCDAMIDQYVAAGIGRREQYTRVWSGFDLDPFLRSRNDPAVRARLGIADSDFVIGTIARLAPLKGHDDLLRMLPDLARRCPGARLLLLGEGPLRPALERKLQKLGLAHRVCFAGLVAPEEVPRHVGIMDVLVHLSYREGLPRALPQAMAAGLPVVAYDCDGAREVCRDRETGLLVPPGDAAGATLRLLELAADADLRKRFGERGRELVRGLFGIERMVDDLHRLYVELRERGESGRDRGVANAGTGRGLE